MLKLYDLAGGDEDLRFSPFCWRAKMALRHKGLEFETVPWRYTEKPAIAASGQGRVPVLVEDGQWLHDSWRIALHLDEAYPDRPPLFPGGGDRAAARFMTAWCDLVLNAALRPLLLPSIFAALADRDRAYFRESREKMLGQRLEEVCPDRDAATRALTATLAPLEATLDDVAFLGGDRPTYTDHVAFGSLQWAHVASPAPLLDPAGAVAGWFERMLDLFDGYGRGARTVRDGAGATAG